MLISGYYTYIPDKYWQTTEKGFIAEHAHAWLNLAMSLWELASSKTTDQIP